jgi:hypothetical protein
VLAARTTLAAGHPRGSDVPQERGGTGELPHRQGHRD